MSHAVVDHTPCTNCGASMHGPYCARCGERAHALNPTLRDVMHDLLHEVLHLDGKIFRTIWLLLSRPGFLTREWLLGRRERYISPLRIFLTFSVISFGMLAWLPERAVSGDETARESRRRMTIPTAARGDASTIQLTPEESGRVAEQAIHLLPRINFILVPLCAGLVMLAARKAKRNYPAHLYFMLHVHSAFFALVVLTWPLGQFGNRGLNQIGGWVRTVGILTYATIAFRAVYGMGWFGSAVRTVLVYVAYVALVLIAVGATAFVLAIASRR